MIAATRRYTAVVSLLCLVLAGPLQAQDQSSDPATKSTTSGTEVLEEVVVSGVNLEDQVSPLQRPVS